MSVVIDSSYALACVLPDEPKPDSMASVLGEALSVPFIWPIEIANAVRSAVRSRRLDETAAAAFIAQIAGLGARVVPAWHDDASRYFDWAMKHDLTAYDAIYLDLCLGERKPLATCDRHLARVAARVGVRTLS